ncbi:hypothetical protein A8E12_08985 [Burkholderia cenocepacia]|nr:hypothetical protein A8E12_08985 [Burkholderia cenocepacia]
MRDAACGATMRPASIVTVVAQRRASSASCVTSTSVAPCVRFSSNIRSMTAWPVAASRLPVGSSANRIAGRVTNARASATRCCSPPDSSFG